MDTALEDIANSMQIECPACAARYDVPDEIAVPGRAMRCARCGETWEPRPASAAAPPALAAGDRGPGSEPNALDMRPAGAQPDGAWPEGLEAGFGAESPLVAAEMRDVGGTGARGGGVALAAAWVASAAVLVVACWAVWHFHGRIQHAWRPSERLFRLFGT